MRRYLISFALATALTGLGLTGLNWLVDPYRIFGAPEIDGVNTIKTRIGPNERVFKTAGLAGQKPVTVLLGTSCTDIGLDPLHPVFVGKKTLNLAMSGQPYSETRWLVDNLDPTQTRQMVLGIDFVAAFFRPLPGSVPENSSAYRKLELLLSYSTTKDSIKTLMRVGQAPGNEWTREGQWVWNDDLVKSHKGNHYIFGSMEQNFLADSAQKRTLALDSRHGYPSPMEDVRAILARAYRENIDLHLFISPSHARLWETLAAAGLWDMWEEWKRLLTAMNEAEAAMAGKPPFPIWDFSGYNSISSEALPALGDTKNVMRYYFDGLHYAPAAGNLVLDRMFDYRSPGRSVPDDFGALITSANLDSHLARIRAARERYRHTHAADVAEIEASAQEAAKEERR